MIFSDYLFGSYVGSLLVGIALGFTLGFIAWAIGYVIFALTKFFKMAQTIRKECLMTTILATAPTMDLSGIQTSMTSAFKQVQTGATDMITAAVPFALVIIGTVLAVTIGIKVFKKLTAQAQSFGLGVFWFAN